MTLDEKKKSKRKERVVILGSGWAGYGFARTLDPSKYERIVVSPRSYFVFTPLLASTAVGTLEFRAVLEPVRRLPGAVTFHQGWADDIDFSRKTIRVEANTRDDIASKTLPPTPHPVVTETGTGTGTGSASGSGSGSGTQVASTATTAADRGKGRRPQFLDVPYDKLVIAVGAYSQTFGIRGVREHAHFLRDIGDARRTRLRVLSLFERCASPATPDARRAELLHFAVVGGGPTGIEFAAELHDLVHEDLRRIYPALMPFVRITVYDIAPAVLPMFDRQLANYATEQFRRRGISVKTEHHLVEIRRADDDDDDDGNGGDDGGDAGALRLRIRENGDEEVGVGMVVWSTGLMQNPLIEKLVKKEFRMPKPSSFPGGGKVDRIEEEGEGETRNSSSASSSEHPTVRLVEDARTGGIVTDPFLRARIATAAPTAPTATAPKDGGGNGEGSSEVLPDVFVVGDCAVMENQPTLPKTAQVASQQALYLARQLNSTNNEAGERKRDKWWRMWARRTSGVDSNSSSKPFRFRNWGTMAYLGSWKAIHQSDADELRGWSAWVLWRSAYATYTISVRNKVMVPVYWVISWIFGRDISRF